MKRLLDKINDILYKNFFLELVNKFKEEFPKGNIVLFINNIPQSGIVEQYEWLIHKIKPVIYSGLNQAGISDFTDTTIRDILDYIVNNYPVYILWKNQLIKNFIFNFQKIYSATITDKNELTNLLNLKEKDFVTSIRLGVGDRHRGGKTVAIVTFSNDSKIIYKPRNLSIDLHFGELIDYINKAVNVDLISPRVIVHEDYGWAEYIDYKECKTEIEVQQYYYRIGCLLAIFYTLEASDFHYENIICNGEFPVPIDLESFFSPYNPIDGTETNQALNQSVLRTGLLPVTVHANTDDSFTNSVDIGGLSDVEGAISITEDYLIKYKKNGTVVYNRKRGKLKGGKNIPSLSGAKIDMSEKYINKISQGFELIYMYILNNKYAYINQLSKFNNDKVRILFRNTVSYVHLLNEANNINILKSHDKLKDLITYWLKDVTPDYKLIERFVDFEITDLINCDIPLFTTQVNSRNLWYSDNGYLSNFFESTGYETVKNKILQLSLSDLQNQQWIIRTILNIRKKIKHDKYKSNFHVYDKEIVSKSDTNLLLKQSVDKVKNYILHNINLNDKQINWLIIRAGNIEANSYDIYEASYDLFSGMPGEILFLAYYGKIYNDKQILEISRKAYNYLLKILTQSKNSIKPIGLYSGWGSILYLNTSLAKIYEDNSYLYSNLKIINTINFIDLINRDYNFGLIKGSAGFICACIDLYKEIKDEKVLYIAEYAADHLIKNKTEISNGYGWRIASKRPLTGLGHGASGFILAFCRLYEITKKEIYKDTLLKILNYENSQYDYNQQNWRDLRDCVSNFNTPFFSTAWSHGAGGIGLCRLELLKAKIFEKQALIDLQAAIHTTLLSGFNLNFSLSFGSFGNIDFIYEYLKHNPNKEIEYKFRKLLNILLINVLDDNFNTGLDDVKTLGLMSGITGIGYECIRLLNPEKVPSILLI